MAKNFCLSHIDSIFDGIFTVPMLSGLPHSSREQPRVAVVFIPVHVLGKIPGSGEKCAGTIALESHIMMLVHNFAYFAFLAAKK